MEIDTLYSEESENILIGTLIIDKDNRYNYIFNELTSKDFYQKKLVYLFEAIKKLKLENKPVDVVTLFEYLKFTNELELAGGQQTINDLALLAVDTDIDIKQTIKTIIKYSKKRLLIYICNNAIDSLNNNTDVDEVASSVSTQVSDLITRTVTKSFTGLMNGIIEVMEDVETLIQSGRSTLGLSTPFNDLDILLNGLCAGRFYILGARPSMGKSAFIQQLAEHVAKDNNVLLFSLEMGLKEYTQRSLYRNSGYNQEHLTRGDIPKEQILDAFSKASIQLEPLKLFIVDDDSCTLNTIEKNIQQCKAKNGSCDLVIVDYLQLMKSNDKYKHDDYDIVTDNSKGLKRLARKYKIPIIALAQLSRQVEVRADKRPILADLRDSGSLEQDADVVMFLHRPIVFAPTNYILRDKAELIIAKNRQGQRGKIVNLIFNEKKAEFIEPMKGGLDGTNRR